MIHARPGRLAPLLASLAVGAVLAGAGLTLADPPGAALVTDSAGRNGAPTVSTPTPSVTAAAPTPVTSAPPTLTATPTSPKRAPDLAGGVAAVVAATNAERKAGGCGPLKVDTRLAKAAQAHSADMARTRTLWHTGSDGSSFDERILAAGYASPAGENVAFGQRTATAVVAAWMESPGHRRNILNCTYDVIGVGHDPRGHYWTQDFGF